MPTDYTSHLRMSFKHSLHVCTAPQYYDEVSRPLLGEKKILNKE